MSTIEELVSRLGAVVAPPGARTALLGEEGASAPVATLARASWPPGVLFRTRSTAPRRVWMVEFLTVQRVSPALASFAHADGGNYVLHVETHSDHADPRVYVVDHEDLGDDLIPARLGIGRPLSLFLADLEVEPPASRPKGPHAERTAQLVRDWVLLSRDERLATIDHGVDVHFVDDEGWALIHLAAKDAHPAAVAALLRQGADPNLRGTGGSGLSAGSTPLHAASKKSSANPRDQQETVRVLLAAGADPCATSTDGVTPLHWATSSENPDIIPLLAAAGADPTALAPDGADWSFAGLSPLHVAAREHGTRALRALLAGGADPNVRDTSGRTPLHHAAEGGFVPPALALLAAGAAVDLRCGPFTRPRDAASLEGPVDGAGATPLTMAAMKGRQYIVRALLEAGASPELAAEGFPGVPGRLPTT